MSENGSGCPELFSVIKILSLMTNEEYNSIMKRSVVPKKKNKESAKKGRNRGADSIFGKGIGGAGKKKGWW